MSYLPKIWSIYATLSSQWASGRFRLITPSNTRMKQIPEQMEIQDANPVQSQLESVLELLAGQMHQQNRAETSKAAQERVAQSELRLTEYIPNLFISSYANYLYSRSKNKVGLFSIMRLVVLKLISMASAERSWHAETARNQQTVSRVPVASHLCRLWTFRPSHHIHHHLVSFFWSESFEVP